MERETEQKIERLVEILKSTMSGEFAIAIAGSHAKGTADKDSDIDFFIYARQPKDYETRKAIIEAHADKGTPMWISPDFHDGAWGGSMDFTFEGTPVETTVKLLDEFMPVFNRCLSGDFRIIPANWTTNGYADYICLSEADFIKPLCDDFGIIKELKEKTRHYPQKLKKAICERMLEQSSFWLDSFHFESAIKRADIMFTAPLVARMLLDAVQIVFALNEVFFTGDKKLAEKLLKLHYCPEALSENIEFLLCAKADCAVLKRQQEIYAQLREKTENLA